MDNIRRLLYKHNCLVFILNQKTGANYWGGKSIRENIDMQLHAVGTQGNHNYIRTYDDNENKDGETMYIQNDYSISEIE